MPVYENSHFGFRIEIPAPWTLTSWKHSKIRRSWKPLYQSSDDDFPDKLNSSKFLFVAQKPPATTGR